jgi:hypothetical protein
VRPKKQLRRAGRLDKRRIDPYRVSSFMLRECFADEIAIDFPSVDPVVERIRASFLGERADAGVMRAEVVLSSREAIDGLIVPVEIPIHGTCPRCGGRGETWTERCTLCDGSGERLSLRVVRVTVPPRVADGTSVRFRVSAPDAPSVRVELRVAISSNRIG